MRFPWQHPQVEVRENSPFTDAVIQGILNATTPSAPGDALAIGALETAAALWSRGFAAATVTPMNRATASITPSVLAIIGRELVRRGQAVFAIKVVDGMAVLVPVGTWDTRGPWSESEWTYRVDMFGASEHQTELLPSAGVVDVRYSVDPATPWVGQSPLSWARLTGQFAANVEQRLSEEASAPVGHLLPVPTPAAPAGDDDDFDPTADLRRDLKALKGGVALVETTTAGMGLGKSEAPQSDWVGRRFGANPPVGVISTYGLSAHAVLNACGVPVSLATDADGTGQRESWRRFAMGSLEPTSNLVVEELAKKLDTPDLHFDFSSLWARDLVARGQFVKAAVGAGMLLPDALKEAGLDD